MENILILDTETTGLSTESNQIIEVAAVLFNINSRTIIHQASTLLYSNSNAQFCTNKIPVEALESVNINLCIKTQELIAQMMIQSDAIVCHNKHFDKKFVDTLPILSAISNNKQWICTLRDVVWPVKKGSSLKLTNLCLQLGIPIISTEKISDDLSILILSYHRALQDCLLLASLLCKMTDIDKFLLNSKI